jgi:hypothetical protein
MRKRKLKTRTRYLKPRRFLDAETGPEDDPDREEPINGCGETQESK